MEDAMRSVHLIVLLLVSVTLAAFPGAVPAEITQCTVASLPATISASGIYCLNADFNLNLASDDAIASPTAPRWDCRQHCGQHRASEHDRRYRRRLRNDLRRRRLLRDHRRRQH